MVAIRLASGRPRLLSAVAVTVLLVPLLPAPAPPCGTGPPAGSRPAQVLLPVVVAMDGSWRDAYGANAEAEAQLLIERAGNVLQPTGVALVVDGYQPWPTNGAEDSMSQMLHNLEASVPASTGGLVIGLTARKISRVDGIARVGHSHLVTRHNPGRPDRDALVVAHEVGHALGAEHDRCEHDFRDVMAQRGFGMPPTWCTHHAQEVLAGAAERLAG